MGIRHRAWQLRMHASCPGRLRSVRRRLAGWQARTKARLDHRQEDVLAGLRDGPVRGHHALQQRHISERSSQWRAHQDEQTEVGREAHRPTAPCSTMQHLHQHFDVLVLPRRQVALAAPTYREGGRQPTTTQRRVGQASETCLVPTAATAQGLGKRRRAVLSLNINCKPTHRAPRCRGAAAAQQARSAPAGGAPPRWRRRGAGGAGLPPAS